MDVEAKRRVNRNNKKRNSAEPSQGENSMAYDVNGTAIETDEEGYVLEPDYSADICPVIAAQEGIALTPAHWQVIEYLRERFQEDGQTPNYRHMLKELEARISGCDSKMLYDLFPLGPAKQGARIAGLPKPFGKGGY
jgi:tRNA 2-thiouridine synthesizing protein E